MVNSHMILTKHDLKSLFVFSKQEAQILNRPYHWSPPGPVSFWSWKIILKFLGRQWILLNTNVFLNLQTLQNGCKFFLLWGFIFNFINLLSLLFLLLLYCMDLIGCWIRNKKSCSFSFNSVPVQLKWNTVQVLGCFCFKI